jgi:hypothetical protein
VTAANEIAAFANEARESKIWNAVDVRSIAVKVDGSWENLVTVVKADHRKPKTLPTAGTLPKTSTIRCFHSRKSISELASLLQNINDGIVPHIQGSVKLHRGHDSSTGRSLSYGDPYLSFDEAFAERSIGFSRHSMRWGGSPVHNVLQAAGTTLDLLDHALRNEARPSDGLYALADEFVGSRTELGPSHMAMVSFTADVQAKLEASQLSNGNTKVTVRCANKELARLCTVGFVSQSEEGTGRGVHQLPVEDWRRKAGCWQQTLDIETAPGGSVALLLCALGRCVDRIVVADETLPPALLSAYRLYDSNLGELRDLLFPDPGSESRNFELAVGRLFTFLGFKVDVLTRSKVLRQAVDVIAVTPDDANVLAIECTSLGINSDDKLGKLQARLEVIRRGLGEYNVIGLMITALERSGILEANLQAAAQNGIVVLSREDLDDLFEMIEVGRQSEEAMQLIGRRRAAINKDRVDFN